MQVVRMFDVRLRFRGSALLLVAGMIACWAASPPAASAGQYEVVDACKRFGEAFGIRGLPAPRVNFGFRFEDRCQPTLDGSIALVAERESGGGLEWEIATHPDTTIRGLEYERSLQSPGSPRFSWQMVMVSASPLLPSENLEVISTPDPSFRTMVHHEPFFAAKAIVARFACASPQVLCTGTQAETARAEARDFTLTMEDKLVPGFTAPIGGSLFSADPVQGIRSVTYSAADVGSGIAGALLIFDDVDQALVPEPNGGKCVEPYVEMVPCRLAVSSSFQFDTKRIPDGTHEVQLALVDASGNRRESPAVLVEVRNTPSNAKSPEISGPAEVGGTLRATKGEWEGAPATFTYRWLRCPEAAERISECGPIAGATGTEYTLGREDLGTRALVEVTATNESGSESAFSDATSLVEESLDQTPPGLKGVRLSRKAFRVASARTALAAAAKTARGTLLSFSSSEAGRLSIAIARAGKRSAKPLAVLRREVRAGRGKLALSGRIGRRALRPGRYLLAVAVTDAAGNASKPAVLSLKVLAG